MGVFIKFGRNLAGVAAAPTGSLGVSYPTITTLQPITIQNISRPPYRTWVTDSTFKATLGYDLEYMRVTDNNGVFGSPSAPYILDPGYSKQQNWSKDGLYFKVGRRFILDAANDYAYIKSTGTPSGTTTWSNFYPHHLWVVGSGKITLWDPTQASASATVSVYDFTSLYDWNADWSLGNDEGNVSDNDKYMIIITQKVGSSDKWLVKINLQNGTVESERSLTQLGITNTVNWAGISGGSGYVIVALNTAQNTDYEKRVFNANTWEYLGSLGPGDHMDFNYDGSGQEVMTKMNNPRVINIATKVSLDIVSTVDMVNIYGPSNSGGHSSGQNRIGLPNWAFFSFTSDNNPTKEIFAAKLDASNQFMRFGSMRYDRYDYNNEGQASPNRDGTMVTFASNWMTGATGSVDSYIVRKKLTQ